MNSLFDLFKREYSNLATCSGRSGGGFGERRKHRRDVEVLEGSEVGGLREVLSI